MYAYENGDYEKSIELLSKYVLAHENDIPVQFYLGCSFMARQRHLKATQYFEAVIESQYTEYIEVAMWYKALCLLKLNQIEELKTQLQDVQQLKGDYEQKSKTLLNNL